MHKQKPENDKKTILLIDDEADLIDLVKFQLIAKGYNAIVTRNGIEALKLLERIVPDLIILDMNMPGMGGVEFYNKISSGYKRSKYPVLVVTARANLEETFKDVEIDGFMTKPFDIGNLIREVDRIIFGDIDPIIFFVDFRANPNVKRMAEELSEERYTVVTVEGFKMLKNEAEKKRPDFIVLEYVQKEMAGDAFIKKIKADPLLSDIPLIGYSYTGFAEYEEIALRSGADKYIGKPKNSGDFLRAIKELKMKRSNYHPDSCCAVNSDINSEILYKGECKVKKILVVDDEEIVRLSLEKELSAAGYSVLTAENGKDGIRIAQEQEPDLILLDIMMPEMDGSEAGALLKSDKRTKDTPIIFITSLLEKDEVEDGFVTGSKGVDQYFISKPFDMDEVFRLVRASIGEP